MDRAAVIERCPDTNLYVGYVPGFPGAHSQGASLDELHANLQEVIAMLLDDGEYHLKPGDCVIDLAAWHAWRNINAGSMAFVFVAAKFGKEVK